MTRAQFNEFVRYILTD